MHITKGSNVPVTVLKFNQLWRGGQAGTAYRAGSALLVHGTYHAGSAMNWLAINCTINCKQFKLQ